MGLLELEKVLSVNPALRAEPVPPHSVFLIGEAQRFVLSDFRTYQVLAAVDGKRSVGEIARVVGSRISQPETLSILDQLVARGYLVSLAGDVPLGTAAFWHGVGLDASVAVGELRRTPVSVKAIGNRAHAESLAGALVEAGVRVDGDAPFQVVVTDDYLCPDLSAINAAMLAASGSWILVKPLGTKPLFGPLFRPHLGPCWECLAFWMRNDRPVEELVRRRRGQHEPISPPLASTEASVRAACGFAALLVARVLVSLRSASGHALDSQVLALDFASFQTSAHAVVERPQCGACGDPGLMKAVGERPIELRPVEKTHVSDGGYRRHSPRETYERYKHLISPLTGPVTHVVPMPGRDTDLRAVYASGYLACPRHEVPHSNVFDKVCAGKGRSPEQARASALCEALERCSGVYQGDEARIRATRDALGPAAIPLADLLNFSHSQYRERQRINRPGSNPRERVPEPLAGATAIDWTPGWSLTHGARRYVPLAYCYAEAPPECGVLFCQPCGNGVAAGTCVEEAILQGLLELIERDAVSIWWYNRVCRPAIDIGSFNDHYFDSLRADYDRLGWKIWVLDLTHDLRIPTCAALAQKADGDRFAIGFGCHLDPHLAVQRALTELNQLFEPTGERRAPWDPGGVSDFAHLFPRTDRAAVSFDGLPPSKSSDLRADIEHCMQALEERGLDVVVVDKTRPDIGLSVAQVIVPGLRHFWPRFGPGRLYDVPVHLGWIPRPLAESDLNPVPLFV